MPDLARIMPTVQAVVSRGTHTTIVLPQWEGHPWWMFAQTHCYDITCLSDMSTVVSPNSVGLPRWKFLLFFF
jgi:hypothetical protein